MINDTYTQHWMSHISPEKYGDFMNCTLEFRTTDDVLDPEDHTVVRFLVSDGHIIQANISVHGVHAVPQVLGRPVEQLLKLAVLSPEEQFPSVDSEIRVIEYL